MFLTALLAISSACWLVLALALLKESFKLTQHNLPLRRRQVTIQRMRWFSSTMLLSLTAMLVGGGLSFERYDLFPMLDGVPLKALLALFGIAYLMLVVVTVVFPDLPGRAVLRRIENLGGSLIAIALAVLGIVAIRLLPWAITYKSAVGALFLSLMFGFFIASRAYLRGALVVGDHIVKHGSHANREATLKRLMRRYRPFVLAGICALATATFILA